MHLGETTLQWKALNYWQLSLGESRAQPHPGNRRRRVIIVTLASCHLERVSHLDRMFYPLMEKFLVLFY